MSQKNQIEYQKYFEINENANITYQNLQDAEKTVLRGTLRVTNAYIKKKKKDLNKILYFKEL